MNCSYDFLSQFFVSPGVKKLWLLNKILLKLKLGLTSVESQLLASKLNYQWPGESSGVV